MGIEGTSTHLELSRQELNALLDCFTERCEETRLSDIEQADMLRRIRAFRAGLPLSHLEYPTVHVEVRRRHSR